MSFFTHSLHRRAFLCLCFAWRLTSTDGGKCGNAGKIFLTTENVKILLGSERASESGRASGKSSDLMEFSQSLFFRDFHNKMFSGPSYFSGSRLYPPLYRRLYFSIARSPIRSPHQYL